MASMQTDIDKTDIRLLILDIDGVVNLSSGISKDAMACLSNIIKKTNCQIALSSTWRKQLLTVGNKNDDSPWFSLCKKYPFLSKNKFAADTPIIKRPPNPKIIEITVHKSKKKTNITNNNDTKTKDEDDNDIDSDSDSDSDSDNDSESESESEEKKDFSAE